MDTFKLITGHVVNNQICKYFKFDSDLLSSIQNNYLWFSNPKDFNDPYDCNLLFDTDNTKQEIIEFISRNTTQQLFNNFIHDPQRLKLKIHKFIRKTLLDEYGICCFSENPLDLLMWSHYADKHKGVCLIFDIQKDLNFFTFPLKVDYFEKYPKFNYIRNSLTKSKMTIQHVLATKPINYKYEQEVRIIKEKRNCCNFRGSFNFNKSSLIEIIFGLNTPENQKRDFFDLVTSNGYCPQFSYITLKDSDFGLDKKVYCR